MKREITQLLYDRITPPKEGRITITDKHLPGLYLRVSASGAKSWSTMYRVGGKQIKETLGTYRTSPTRGGERWSHEKRPRPASTLSLKLPRFRGHRLFWVRGVHDGQDKSSLPA